MRQVLLVDKVVGQLEIGVEDGIRGRDRSAWTEGMGGESGSGGARDVMPFAPRFARVSASSLPSIPA